MTLILLSTKNLKNPINVKLADGRTLKGTKVGKILTYFEVSKRRVKIIVVILYFRGRIALVIIILSG